MEPKSQLDSELSLEQMDLPSGVPNDPLDSDEDNENQNSHNSGEQQGDDDSNEQGQSGGSEGEESAGQNKTNRNRNRVDNSLSVLTKKFVDLIRSSQGQTIDLNTTVISLGVQKRRIYDITNVLQGIGYVQKVHKNHIKWIGTVEDPQMDGQVDELLLQLDRLITHQRKLDRYLQVMSSNVLQQLSKAEQGSNKPIISSKQIKQVSSSVYKQSKQTLIIFKSKEGKLQQSSTQTDKSINKPILTYTSITQDAIDVFVCKDGGDVIKMSENYYSE